MTQILNYLGTLPRKKQTDVLTDIILSISDSIEPFYGIVEVIPVYDAYYKRILEYKNNPPSNLNKKGIEVTERLCEMLKHETDTLFVGDYTK